MEYIGWSVVALLAVLFMGLLVVDQRRASLEMIVGVVVGKRVPYRSLLAPGGAWEMSLSYETFELDVKYGWKFDISTQQVDAVPVSKSQYDETPIGATIYAKYLETRFLKNKILLDFAILVSDEPRTWKHVSSTNRGQAE